MNPDYVRRTLSVVYIDGQQEEFNVTIRMDRNDWVAEISEAADGHVVLSGQSRSSADAAIGNAFAAGWQDDLRSFGYEIREQP